MRLQTAAGKFSCLLLGVGIAVGNPRQLRAQAGDTLVSRQLAPGVEYRQFTDKAGPWRVNLVRINLKVARVEFRPARAGDLLRSREKTTSMVPRMTTCTRSLVSMPIGTC